MSKVRPTSSKHCGGEGSQADGHKHGYKDPPIPRRLVGESQVPPGLSPTNSGSSKLMSKTRLNSKFGKVGAGAQANLQFCRLPIRPQGRSGPTHTGPVSKPTGQITGNIVTTDSYGYY